MTIVSARINIHDCLPRSRSNGPGLRYVVWFQGCTLGCPGCFNPDLQPTRPRRLVEPESLFELIEAEAAAIEGLTVSGGEPFLQPEGLLALVSLVRERTSLSVIVFSGFERRRIESMPLGPSILEGTDVLIDGPYMREQRLADGLRGSANQSLHFLSGRYGPGDFADVPPAEIVIRTDGSVEVSGVDPWRPETLENSGMEHLK